TRFRSFRGFAIATRPRKRAANAGEASEARLQAEQGEQRACAVGPVLIGLRGVAREGFFAEHPAELDDEPYPVPQAEAEVDARAPDEREALVREVALVAERQREADAQACSDGEARVGRDDEAGLEQDARPPESAETLARPVVVVVIAARRVFVLGRAQRVVRRVVRRLGQRGRPLPERAAD